MVRAFAGELAVIVLYNIVTSNNFCVIHVLYHIWHEELVTKLEVVTDLVLPYLHVVIETLKIKTQC